VSKHFLHLLSSNYHFINRVHQLIQHPPPQQQQRTKLSNSTNSTVKMIGNSDFFSLLYAEPFIPLCQHGSGHSQHYDWTSAHLLRRSECFLLEFLIVVRPNEVHQQPSNSNIVSN